MQRVGLALGLSDHGSCHEERRFIATVDGDDTFLRRPARERSPLLHAEEFRARAVFRRPGLWYDRVPVFTPSPEDRLVGLNEIADVSKEPVEDLEILRCFRAFDGEQDVAFERFGRQWTRGRRPRDLGLEPRDPALPTRVKRGEASSVEIRKRTDGD